MKQKTKEDFAIARSQVTYERPKKAELPDKKVSYVRRLFAEGPAEYDLLLKILSLSRDSYWRNRIVESAAIQRGGKVLDIACGTGLVTYSFAKAGSYVVGVDVTAEMIKRARALPEYKGADVDFVLARAENLPFKDNSFDASSISLALRNVSSQVETLSEMRRCIKQGSRVICLDFARPRGWFFSPFYKFYIFRLLPTIGLFISKHWNTIFLYLANSIEKSRDPEKILETMDSLGLSQTSMKRLTHGTTALISGMK